jgi:hypothetical protein
LLQGLLGRLLDGQAPLFQISPYGPTREFYAKTPLNEHAHGIASPEKTKQKKLAGIFSYYGLSDRSRLRHSKSFCLFPATFF